MAVKILLTGGDPSAGGKSVPLISWVAAALWDMVGHGAGGVDTTHPGARVHTLVADTGKSLGTVGVDGTLGFALDVGIALEARVAGAGGRLVHV